MTDQEIAKDIQLKHISKIAEKLALKNTKVLAPKNSIFKKLITYVPISHFD